MVGCFCRWVARPHGVIRCARFVDSRVCFHTKTYSTDTEIRLETTDEQNAATQWLKYFIHGGMATKSVMQHQSRYQLHDHDAAKAHRPRLEAAFAALGNTTLSAPHPKPLPTPRPAPLPAPLPTLPTISTVFDRIPSQVLQQETDKALSRAHDATAPLTPPLSISATPLHFETPPPL